MCIHVCIHVCACMYALVPYREFFEGENFYEFHKLIAIHENFIFEMFAKTLITIVPLTFMKIFPV